MSVSTATSASASVVGVKPCRYCHCSFEPAARQVAKSDYVCKPCQRIKRAEYKTRLEIEGRPMTRKASAEDIASAKNYNGVRLHSFGKFMAACRNKYLGLFDTAEEAARQYDKEASKQFGIFAKLNFNSPNPASTKRCRGCERSKAFSEYSKNTRGTLRSQCKECRVALTRLYTRSNREKVKRYKKEWARRTTVKHRVRERSGLGRSILSDWYVKHCIVGKMPIPFRSIPTELVKAKRQQLLIHRQLKEIK